MLGPLGSGISGSLRKFNRFFQVLPNKRLGPISHNLRIWSYRALVKAILNRIWRSIIWAWSHESLIWRGRGNRGFSRFWGVKNATKKKHENVGWTWFNFGLWSSRPAQNDLLKNPEKFQGVQPNKNRFLKDLSYFFCLGSCAGVIVFTNPEALGDCGRAAVYYMGPSRLSGSTWENLQKWGGGIFEQKWCFP